MYYFKRICKQLEERYFREDANFKFSSLCGHFKHFARDTINVKTVTKKTLLLFQGGDVRGLKSMIKKNEIL